MSLKNIFLLFIMMICYGAVSAQQQALNGEWQIVKATVQLYAQQDDKLLEEKTYTTEKEMSEINGQVPLKILFNGHDYIIQSGSTMERGSYIVNSSEVVQLQRANTIAPQIPPVPYKYRLKSGTALELDLPVTFYKDNKRNLAVKLVYTCYYSKH